MSAETSQTVPSAESGADEELPPVTPPSAGFIIQLFLIPALIVAAVVGVWALFSRLAGGDIDVDRLVQELGSTNEHRRWRAAANLSQVLQNERLAARPSRERLSERRDVAEALTGLLEKSLAGNSTADEEIRHQEFLARTLGSLDVDDVVLPVLSQAIAPDADTAVRRSGLMAVVLIAGRRFAAATGEDLDTSRTAVIDLSPLPDDCGLPLAEPVIQNAAVLEQLHAAAQDPEPGIRHLAAYALGLVSGPKSMDLLKVMLLDADLTTRANAATALARNADPAGVPVLLSILSQPSVQLSEEDASGMTAAERRNELSRRQFDQSAMLINGMTAIGRLWTRISAADQEKLRAAVRSVAENHDSPGVRLHATALLRQMEQASAGT